MQRVKVSAGVLVLVGLVCGQGIPLTEFFISTLQARTSTGPSVRCWFVIEGLVWTVPEIGVLLAIECMDAGNMPAKEHVSVK